MIDRTVLSLLAGEIAFWVLIAGGLVARYLLGQRRVGAVLLGSTVLVDLTLLAIAVVSVRAGGIATAAHGLAALYVGFSVAFGPALIAWADQWAAYRWAGGPRPVKVPRRGPERARYEWTQFGRWLVAAAISAAALGLVILLAGPNAGVDALHPWFGRLGLVTVIWFVTGPAWHLDRRRSEVRPEGSHLESDR